MTRNHDKSRRQVSEPVQVYLDSPDRARLERLTEALDATKSDVLRRGLEALERQLTDPTQHPSLRIIGIGGGYPRRDKPTGATAREHDRILADDEVASWTDGGIKQTKRRAHKRKRGN